MVQDSGHGQLLPFNGNTLRLGAVLASLAHACYIIAKPALSNEQYWDGNRYCVEDTGGAFGTVTLMTDIIVGGFFDAHSERNPFKLDQNYSLERYLAGMPDQHHKIAENGTFRFMLQDYRGAEKSNCYCVALGWRSGHVWFGFME